jgi:hypothetical protein
LETNNPSLHQSQGGSHHRELQSPCDAPGIYQINRTQPSNAKRPICVGHENAGRNQAVKILDASRDPTQVGSGND